MAIEGPLRELGIHDVFQMLDLSRKTGALRVTSELRDNEGTVMFDRGRVISASIRSTPTRLGAQLVRAGRISEADLEQARSRQTAGDGRPLGVILVEMGAIGTRELERQVRLQIETVVFDLMSWREGFFSFEECDVSGEGTEAAVQVSTESLLMEGARRIDEWSRIVDRVPNLAVVPVLASVHEDHATLLDLLPSEWEVLATIDGEKDLRGMAVSLGRSEFDVAKVVYGLLSTGVVEVRDMTHPNGAAASAPNGVDPISELAKARAALAGGRAEDALTAARLAIGAQPANVDARLTAARALRRLQRFGDAAEELRRAADVAPESPAIQMEMGFAALRRGDFQAAVGCWERFLVAAPASSDAATVRQALAAATDLHRALEAHSGG